MELQGGNLEDLKQTLITLEEQLFTAETRASLKELDDLLATDFTEIGASGIRFGKQEALERLPTEMPPTIKASDYELRQLGPNCAQLLYKASMIKHGEPTPIYSLRSSIWGFIDGCWKMTFHQGTLCKPFTK